MRERCFAGLVAILAMVSSAASDLWDFGNLLRASSVALFPRAGSRRSPYNRTLAAADPDACAAQSVAPDHTPGGSEGKLGASLFGAPRLAPQTI